MTDLLELAERCERASGPDRELDAMIHFRIKNGIGCGYAQDAPAYTASMDAAMTLVPEGWSHGYSCNTTRGWAHAYCELIPTSPFNPFELRTVHSPKCTHPALALTAAALRARHAEKADG